MKESDIMGILEGSECRFPQEGRLRLSPNQTTI